MNPKNLLIFSALFTVMVIALGCTETGTNTDNTDKTTPTTPAVTDEFVTTNDNFEFITVQYTNPSGSNSETNNTISSLNLDCASFKNGTINPIGHEWVTDHDIYIMYNIKDVPGKFLRNGILDSPLACNFTIDGKTYFKLDTYQIGVVTMGARGFCAPAVMSTERQVCVSPYTTPIGNFTFDHTITLCCGDICKTKTLPAYCK